MITAANITVEQLRELQEKAIATVAGSSPYHLLWPMRERPGVELLYATTYALGEERFLCGYDIAFPGGKREEYVAEGRLYCAELLNALDAQFLAVTP